MLLKGPDSLEEFLTSSRAFDDDPELLISEDYSEGSDEEFEFSDDEFGPSFIGDDIKWEVLRSMQKEANCAMEWDQDNGKNFELVQLNEDLVEEGKKSVKSGAVKVEEKESNDKDQVNIETVSIENDDVILLDAKLEQLKIKDDNVDVYESGENNNEICESATDETKEYKLVSLVGGGYDDDRKGKHKLEDVENKSNKKQCGNLMYCERCHISTSDWSNHASSRQHLKNVRKTKNNKSEGNGSETSHERVDHSNLIEYDKRSSSHSYVQNVGVRGGEETHTCLLYTSPSPRD